MHGDGKQKQKEEDARHFFKESCKVAKLYWLMGTLLIQTGFGIELLVPAMEAAVVNVNEQRTGIAVPIMGSREKQTVVHV
jgi:hypothetical protein